ncbi:MAG: long-chain fatty acid--CoA ligase [Tenericutes bacterium]|nr:long-chain fatty acid--CoA ligase [Mycoplasmatota bacterium]
MGIVNDYIKKMLDSFKKPQIDNERPWLKYYIEKEKSEHLTYLKGSMYDGVKDTASRNENRVALRFYGVEITYKKFMKNVDLVAASLQQFNIVENECVTICMPNSPESFALIYAVNKIGAIANIVHPLSTTKEIERALSETNSSTLFCADVSMPKARDIKVKNFVMVPTSTSLPKVLKVLYNIKNSANMKIEKHMLNWDMFILNFKEGEFYVKRKDTDPCAIIYSGGTTGKPKGIILSNLNFSAMAQQTAHLCDLIRPGYSVLSALPIFHVFGLSVCVHTCLLGGMTLIVLPKIDTKNINKELKKHKPNVFPAVPSLIKLIVNGNDPGKNGFKDIKLVVVGGDYLSADLRIEMEKYLKDHGSSAIVKIGYGLSEASGFASSNVLLEEHLDSLGIPNPDTELKIFEPGSDIEKHIGDIGEICITGPTLMMGYINEDKETNNTLVKHIDGKVWLHTGDLGYKDENGIFYYSSRLKRMIISNGYNIYPIELEEIITKCEYVSACTVIGIPHKIKSQVPKAVIVLKKGVEDTPKVRTDIKRYCYENIAKYAIPAEYEFRDSLPVTAVGKVAYKTLENEHKK